MNKVERIKRKITTKSKKRCKRLIIIIVLKNGLTIKMRVRVKWEHKGKKEKDK